MDPIQRLYYLLEVIVRQVADCVYLKSTPRTKYIGEFHEFAY